MAAVVGIDGILGGADVTSVPNTSVTSDDRSVRNQEFVAEAMRERRRRKRRLLIAQVMVFVGFIGAWQLFAGTPGERPWVLIDKYYVSRPTDMLVAIRQWVQTGVIWDHIWATVTEMTLGFVVGAIAGLIVGFLVGTRRTFGAVITPFISAIYSIPRLALIPLFLLWFGIGLLSKVMFVAMIVFFLVFFNTYAGVRDVDRSLLDAMRVMGAKSRHINLKVILPSAGSWILAGLRTSAPYALVAAVTAELFSSNRGLGYLLSRSAGQFYTDGVFGAILLMMAVALVVNSLVVVVERYALAWRERTAEQ